MHFLNLALQWRMQKNESTVTVTIALIAVVFLWASAFVGIRAGLRGYHPGSLALLRYLVASAAMIPLYFRVRSRVKIGANHWCRIILAGVLGFAVYNVGLNYGEVSVTAGMAAFIIGMVPVLSMVIAVAFLGESLSRIGIFGVAISVLGVFILAVTQSHGSSSVLGIFAILIAALSMAIYTTIQKPTLTKIPGLEYASYAIWCGTAVLLVFLPELGRDIHHASLTSTLWVIYLGIFPGAIAYALWSFALSVLPACRTVSYMYSVPLVATLMGWLFLGEVPAPLAVAGGLVALFGAYLVSRNG